MSEQEVQQAREIYLQGPRSTESVEAFVIRIAEPFLRTEVASLRAQLADERMEHNLLKEMLSRPEIDEFLDGVTLEAAHQRQRWGDAHDRSKSAENWFWLVGYLSGKALRSAIQGDQAHARHHTISSAAALFQWWKAIKDDTSGTGQGADADLSALNADKEKEES